MKIITDLEQGTDAWLLWREQGIGASEIGTILGNNPYETAEGLWKVKSGLVPPKPSNEAMRRGTLLEPAIRAVYETIVSNAPRTPLCAEHDELSWLRASLDGIDETHQYVLEIKAPNSRQVWWDSARGLVAYYYWQCQQQLLVTGAKQVDLFCWMPDREVGPPKLYHILPDIDAQLRLVAQGHAFMRALRTKRPPVVVAEGLKTDIVPVPQTRLPEVDWWACLETFRVSGTNPEEVEGWN